MQRHSDIKPSEALPCFPLGLIQCGVQSVAQPTRITCAGLSCPTLLLVALLFIEIWKERGSSIYCRNAGTDGVSGFARGELGEREKEKKRNFIFSLYTWIIILVTDLILDCRRLIYNGFDCEVIVSWRISVCYFKKHPCVESNSTTQLKTASTEAQTTAICNKLCWP